MISFLIKYKKIILIITLAFFLGSIVYLGANAYSRSGGAQIAAKVGSHTISNRQLYRVTEDQARLLRDQGIDVDEQILALLRQQLLAALIGEEVLNQAAHKAEIDVSDYEIAYDIRRSPLFNQGGQFNKTAYENNIRRVAHMSPAEFEEQLRRGKESDRFRTVLYSHYKLTPAEIQHAYQEQHGNLKNFDQNKKDFATQLLDTKMETAQQAFFDRFNQEVSIKTYLQD